MTETDDLLRAAQAAVAAAMSAGADAADAIASRHAGLSVEFEACAIKNVDYSETASVSVRALKNGGRGLVSGSGLDGKRVRRLGEQAAAVAGCAEADPDFVELAGPVAAPEIEGLWDDALVAMSAAESIDVAARAIEEARSVQPNAIMSGGFGSGWGAGAVANSNGVAVTSRSTSVGLSVFAILRENGQTGSYYDFDTGRRLCDVRFEGLGRVVAERAAQYLGARKIEARKMPIILGPLASYSFCKRIMAQANAESYQRGRSYFCEKLGESVASDVLTLVDDGLIEGGLASSAYDGEGVPVQRVTVLDGGVLSELLHNSYTANKARARNNGHGSLSGNIGPTNCLPVLGTQTARELIAEVDEGLYIESGSISPDGTSGSISSLVDFGFKIEKGELAYPVENTMVAGDAFGFLQGIDAVSSDCRREPGNILPTIRILDVQVA